MSTYENPNNQLTGRLPPQSMLRQRYLIASVAGRGGMSAVYRAVDTQQANRSVAIKEMSQGFMSEEERGAAIARFQQEYNLLNKMHHPNLPQIYDFFNEGDRFYIVMDFIDGKTLFELLRQNGGQPLPVAQVIGYALQLCDVLSTLHNQQPPIIFRDLKPTNVMIRSDGRLYLIDFGIARLFKEGQQQDTVLLGSPGYAPPEQHGSAQTSPRSDLYALGATLHCLLTGRDPFNHPQRFVFPPIRQFNPLVPAELDSLIQQMLAHDERYRPASAEQVKQALLSFRQRAADETSNLPPMLTQTPVMASAPTQYPLPPPPVQRSFDTANANQPPGYRPTVPMESPGTMPTPAATQLARPTRPAYQPRNIPLAGAGLFNRTIWSAKFLTLFVAMLVLTVVGSSIAFIFINNPYGSANPNGLDHAVEATLAIIFIIVALAGIPFVRGAVAIFQLFVSALAAVPAAFAFVVQTVNDINFNAGSRFLAQLTPDQLYQIYTYGLLAASVILLLWALRKNPLVERLTLLVAFGIPLICMLLTYTSTSDSSVPHHVYLLITLITLIQGVLIAARIEQVKQID
jgi:serine/threonine protein kinase